VPWFTGQANIEKFSPTIWERVRNGPFFDLLAPFIQKRAHEMSFGQRRCIELARAFASSSPLLLLDEPFNFLDPEKRHYFLSYLDEQHGRAGTSRVILTTHYVEDIAIRGADCHEFIGEMPHRELRVCGTVS
jgi:ABC-type molybdenum transport system ATPase subunit/photorepair protein PhrA